MFVKNNGEDSIFGGLLFSYHDRIYVGGEDKYQTNVIPSPLANQFITDVKGGYSWEKDYNLDKYREWLWEQIKLGRSGKSNLVWEELLYILYYANRYITREYFYSEEDRQKACIYLTYVGSSNENKENHVDIIIKALEWLVKENIQPKIIALQEKI